MARYCASIASTLSQRTISELVAKPRLSIRVIAAAWVSQHKGKRPLVRISSVLMLVGSLLLLLGADSPGLLFAGRVASGCCRATEEVGQDLEFGVGVVPKDLLQRMVHPRVEP
mgnify:CR=1 FL=1